MKRKFVLLIVCVLLVPNLYSQTLGVKSNLLYLFTGTPNLGLTFRLTNHLTLSLNGGYNSFEYPSSTSLNTKIKHELLLPELQYWRCKSFERSYIGLHGLLGNFNIGGIPFIPGLKTYRYSGNLYGVGLSYGYQWAFGTHWGLEASFGMGYIHFRYDKYRCGSCGDFSGKYVRDYFGPTKASISIIYYLN